MEPALAEHRRELLAGLAGRVVEVGAGNGMNFTHYPATVTEVVAVEPEPYLRARAEEAARAAPVPVTVVEGTAERLPADDAVFDAGVASLVLCSVPDQGPALAELARVIRPGGQLRFYEHVVADTPGLARAQRAADRVWPRVAGGCHTSRDTSAAIGAAGFELQACRRLSFRPCPLAALTAPHVLGRARRP
ncbi:MAG: class I SAM-dependent methyltransferase [Acidimicrobiales bacterium]